ncbi:MAG: hypothetical protein NkDv07_0525 [Candidatus Improbicoccus devescovinae]|nr:MAG: hypothetical protein NkDv07_0525 [Candidatus Improbicoccus devescovinae]
MSENFNLNQFLTEEMFLSLASCILIVTGGVKFFKNYTNLSPLWLNLIISSIVTIVRIAFVNCTPKFRQKSKFNKGVHFIVGDFSFNGIVLGIFNLIPILLGSTGTYEFAKNIIGG